MTSRTLIRTHIPCLKLDTYTVQSIYVLCEGTSYIIRCTCLPEMKKGTVYKIELRLDRVGDITKASCVCPAGMGPSGSCKHIAAL